MRYKGRPVPWITKWTGERLDDDRLALTVRADRAGRARLAYTDEAVTDRDGHGVLWYRDGLAAGLGTPIWADVHTARHRRAMRVLACQVCGQPIRDRPIPWLFSAGEFYGIVGEHDGLGDGDTTATAPTCTGCWDTAARFCPHLVRGGVVRAYVDTATPWGVAGDVYHPGTGEGHRHVLLPYGHKMMPVMLAKQAIVAVSGVRAADR